MRVVFWLEVAVTLAVPTLTDVTNPEVEIVATDVGVMLHETDGLLAGLESLLVPLAVIWTVLSVVPVSMVGDAGPIERELSVGFVKKPVQLTVIAMMASNPKPPTRPSFRLVDDIVV